MIVVNATVLSNLARVDRLGILKVLYGKIVIPIQVYEEILQGINEGYYFLQTVDKMAEEGWTVFEAPTSKKGRKCFKELLASVGYGEAAGISVAKEQFRSPEQQVCFWLKGQMETDETLLPRR